MSYEQMSDIKSVIQTGHCINSIALELCFTK